MSKYFNAIFSLFVMVNNINALESNDYIFDKKNQLTSSINTNINRINRPNFDNEIQSLNSEVFNLNRRIQEFARSIIETNYNINIKNINDLSKTSISFSISIYQIETKSFETNSEKIYNIICNLLKQYFSELTEKQKELKEIQAKREELDEIYKQFKIICNKVNKLFYINPMDFDQYIMYGNSNNK